MRLIKYLAPVILLIGFAAQAHVSGFSYEVAQDGYVVDIGSLKSEISVNDLTLFDFKLFTQADTIKLADFDNVYVTISDSRGVISSGFLYSPKDLLTVYSFRFDKAGKYEMSARFNKGTTKLTEVTFPIDVKGGSSLSQSSMIKTGALVLIGLALVTWGVWQYRKDKSAAKAG
jgi:hypothetical protein